MLPDNRVILIGGTSHTGKSTLARTLAWRLDRAICHTDKLARHPGRPWQPEPKQVPPHVADHYLSLPVDELVADVTQHYRCTVWPLAESIIALYATNHMPHGLILEGSAILPDQAVTVMHDNVAAVWLAAGDETLERRIHTESRYATRSSRGKQMIDKFLARACAFNRRTLEIVKRLGLTRVDVDDAADADELADACFAALAAQGCRLRH